MSKKIIIGIAAVAALGAGYFLFYAKKDQPIAATDASITASATDTEDAATATAADSSLPSTSSAATAVGTSKGVSLDIALTEFKSLNPVITPLDEKEAQWLKKHGYPTAEEIANLDLMSDSELAKGVAKRDPMASVFRGLKAEKAGDIRSAATNFDIAAGRGSIYARQRQAELRRAASLAAMPNLDPYNYNASYLTQLELAKYMGDHRANEAQAARVLPSNTRFDLYSRDVLYRFQALLGQYNTQYEREYGRMPKPEPRPNAAQWERIDRGELVTVTIYVPNKP
jgi:hypothetical protein